MTLARPPTNGQRKGKALDEAMRTIELGKTGD